MSCAIARCSRPAVHGSRLCSACLLAPVVLVTTRESATATLWLHAACAGRVAGSKRWRNMVFEAMSSAEAAGPECAVCSGPITPPPSGAAVVTRQERLW